MPQYDVTLRDYWRILRKRKTIVIFATAMLCITSYVTALLSTPTLRYESAAKVQFEKSQSAQEAYISALGGGDALETEQAVITSHPVLTRVAHRIGRIDSAEATPEQKIRAIVNLKGSIDTELEGLTNIITITVQANAAVEARDIANATAEEYSNYNYETKNAQILNSRQFIQTKRDTVQHRLKVAQYLLRDFQEETQIISIQAQTNTLLSQLEDNRKELKKVESLYINISSLIKEVDITGEATEVTLAGIPPEEAGPKFVQLSNQLQAINQQRNQLLVRYTNQHPKIVDLEASKRVVLQELVVSLRGQLGVIKTRLENHRRVVGEIEARYKQLPELSIRLSDLVRDVETQTELLLVLEEEYQQSQILESGEVREINVLQQALLPSSPTNPSTPRTSATLGALLGMILGVVFAFVAETLDTSIGTIQDVEEFLGVSVVGIIPQVDVDDMKEAMERSGLDADDPELVERRMRLAAHFEPQSTIAESYRGLRTNIQFATLDKGAKLISVTSASHQEGKSTTTANLAMTLAQAGNRVLLVDGDLRRPTIARIFGLDREPGLTDVILGNYTWKEVVRTVTDIMVGGLGMEDIMMTPGMDNLNIITSGLIPPNPAEIIDSRRMNDFLTEVKEAYDVVLVDSPPTLQATDATIIGTRVDGVIMVYRIGQVSRSALQRAKLQLDAVNVPVLGIVINGLRAEVSEDFRDLRYYSYYSYGSQDEDQSTNPIIRTYQRSKRKAHQFIGKVRDKMSPMVSSFAERMGIEIEDAAEDPSQEEGRSAVSFIARIMLWSLLGLFVLTGILWQIGFFRAAKGPAIRSGNMTELVAPSDEISVKLGSSFVDTSQFESIDSSSAPVTPPEPEKSSLSEKKVHPVQPVTPAVQPVTARVDSYYVHTSSHKSRHAANKELSLFARRGLKGRLESLEIPLKGLFHRVLIGPYPGKATAKEAANGIRRNHGPGYTALRKADRL